MSSYRIRQAAVVTDEEVWLDLTLRLWPEATPAELKEDFHRILSSEKEAIFLCQEKEHVLGMAIVALRHDYVEGTSTSPVGYLEGIFVREESRGRKVGRHLVAVAEEWAKQQGCLEMASDVELKNIASQQFHRAAGFQEANRIVCYRKLIG